MFLLVHARPRQLLGTMLRHLLGRTHNHRILPRQRHLRVLQRLQPQLHFRCPRRRGKSCLANYWAPKSILFLLDLEYPQLPGVYIRRKMTHRISGIYLQTLHSTPQQVSRPTRTERYKVPLLSIRVCTRCSYENILLQLARLRSVHVGLAKSYGNIMTARSRAQHELAMSMIELDLAEKRRIIADSQLDRAREGALGIDYVQPSAQPP